MNSIEYINGKQFYLLFIIISRLKIFGANVPSTSITSRPHDISRVISKNVPKKDLKSAVLWVIREF